MSSDLDPRNVDGGLHTTTAPFDAIRHTTPEGREYWSARELMPLMGYSAWQNFQVPLQRAGRAAKNTGHDIAALFMASHESTGGRPAVDYHMSRFGAYLVAMNCDPNKQEVANAQAYFAIRTREAEVAETAPPAAVAMPSHSAALRGWAAELERAELAEAKVAELSPPAAAWTELAEAAGDYSVADAAKVLSRDPAISTGERRLFQSMAGFALVFRRDGRWRAYQSAIDRGWLTEKLAKPYYHQGRDEVVTGEPTVRITPKGIEALQKRFGGGSGQLALAVAE